MLKKTDVVSLVSRLALMGFIQQNGTACRFVSITTKTPVTKIRKGNPFGQLFKVSKKIGLVNANYNKSVQRRIAEKLGVAESAVEYTPGETWYQHLTDENGKALPLVVNKKTPDNGKVYLQYFPHKSENAYVNENGETIADETVKPWLYKESERPDYKPSVISLDLANILQMKASGEIIEMPAFEEAEAVLAD